VLKYKSIDKIICAELHVAVLCIWRHRPEIYIPVYTCWSYFS